MLFTKEVGTWTTKIHELLVKPSKSTLSTEAWREANEVWRLLSNIPEKEELLGPLGRLLDEHDEGIEISEDARKIFEEIYEEFCKEVPERQGENPNTAWADSGKIRGKYDAESVESTFRHELETDGDTEFDQILHLYQNGTKEERQLINAVFVNLCGWSILTLVKMSKGGEV